MRTWFLLGQPLHVGVRGRGIIKCHVLEPSSINPQEHWVVRASATELEGWSRTRPPGRHAAAVSLFKVLHSCWAVIRGEACLSLITAPLVLQTAGWQTAG